MPPETFTKKRAKEMTTKILGVDFDDVIIDFNEGLRIFHNTFYGTSYQRQDIASYDFQPLWGCSMDEVNKRIGDFYHSVHHAELQPVFGAVEALIQLKREYILVLLTSRPEHMRNITTKLLVQHFPNLFSDTYFLGHFSPTTINLKKKTKGEACRAIGVSVFIDDSLEHATTVSREGIPVLLFDTPWNQGDMPENTTRVFSWDDILRILS